MMAETYRELEALSDEKIRKRHDVICSSFANSPSIYQEILKNRSIDRSGKKMEKLTHSMNRMTLIMVLLTVANIGLLIYQIFLAK